MKRFFSLLLLVGLLNMADAKTYYFSSSGSDSYTATQAQSQSTPWKTIVKLNAVFSSLQPGDNVFFKRGDTFYGSVIITKSGTSSAPITIGAYGSGDKPVITGFVTLSNWTSDGGGKYESYNASLGASINMVSMDGASKEMGRYPNSNAIDKGYLYFESHGTNSITDNEFSSSTDWTGAEVVIRSRHWVLDRVKVASQSGRTIKYSPATTYEPYDDYGYFFQNDIRTLDQTGEWYYNASSHKFYMYLGSSKPSGYDIKASVVNDLVHLDDYDNIVFDNLSLQGANEKAFSIYSADNIHVQNCDINLTGVFGVWAQNTKYLYVENCNVSNTNNTGIFLYSNTNSSVIRNNHVRNSGVFAGMGQNGDNQSSGIRANGNYNLIQYNTIDSTGYCAIRFTGDYVTIKNNFINNFNFVKDDGGGIYTSNCNSGDGENFGRQVIGNIILNGIGAKEGSPNKVFQTSSGIYIDNNSAGITVSGNTIANCGKVGLYIHNCYKIVVTDNTCYNNTAQSLLNHDSQLRPSLTDVTFKNNILVSKTTDQKVAMFYTRDNDIAEFGIIDSNYYARPIDDSITIEEITKLYVADEQVKTKHTLSTWRSKYKMYDKNSKKSPQTFDSTLNPDDFIRFEYNASNSDKKITLNATYVDAKGNSFSGSATIPAYGSLVLIKSKTSSIPQTPSVVVTSPMQNAVYNASDNVYLEATANISTDQISKVAFYNGDSLIKKEYFAPYSEKYQSLPSGIYTITAKLYDKSGNIIISDPVTFTVKSSKNGTTSSTMLAAAAQESEVAAAQQPINIQLYPNPARNKVYVSVSGSTKDGKAMLAIQNLSGSTIQRQNVTISNNRAEVDLSSLASGTYTLSFTTGSTVINRKFLKVN